MNSDQTVSDELVKALESNPGICDLLWDPVLHEARIYPQSRVQDDRKQIEQLPAIIYGLQGQSEPRAAACEHEPAPAGLAHGRAMPAVTRSLKSWRRRWRGCCQTPQKWGPAIRELIVLSQDDDFEDETNTHERQIDLSVLAWS